MSQSPQSPEHSAPTELTLMASPVRRSSASAMLVLLGGLLIWVAVDAPEMALPWLALLLVLAVGSLGLAWHVWRASAHGLVLTEEALCDGSGRVVCRLEDIAAVERGTFAFKPSNGFLITLKTTHTRAWAPGVWWRLGRRVGVGGVTPASQGKAMADVIAARIAGQGRID
nr:hypothetical protein [uncultured Celeribacter sp.]